MATTGFWPIKGRLKDAIDYAENPDKTTDRKCLDEDLYKKELYWIEMPERVRTPLLIIERSLR